MLVDTRKFFPPIHKPPRLHKDVLLMSFENQWLIRKIYSEIIGLNEIDHFSINIVDPHGEMSIISYSPSIIYKIFKDGTYLYNGSISPTYYEKLDFYTWDQCYDRRFFNDVKNSLQTKNGIDTGIVMIHRAFNFHVLFSFASKRRYGDLFADSTENSKKFLNMGFHCLDLIKDIYIQYDESDKFCLIRKPTNVKAICRLPNLSVIRNK